MSSDRPKLTEEQIKRIEENRLKAIEKRAAILKSRGNNGINTGIKNIAPLSSNASNYTKNADIFAKKVAPISSVSINNGCNKLSFYKREQTDSNGNKWKQASSNKVSSIQTKVSTSNFYSTNPPSLGTSAGTSNFGEKKISGNFVLCSKDRFIANIPFHAQAIDIFKTMQSRQYDVTTRKWSFSISDHNSLSVALNQLRPAVCVSPLPGYVLQNLKRSTNYIDPGNIDLMSIDPLLLEAFMPFQREGVCFGVSRGGRVLIADDMGLGKTIQALGIAAYYREEWPMLIVTPSSVRYSWADAVSRWIGSVDSYEVLVVNTGKDSLEGSVIIMSYDLLSRRAQEIKDMNFQVVVMDESHMLKNFKSSRYKAAHPVMKACKRLILLSGTPALSRPSELYTQLSAVDSKLFTNFQDFGIRYCAAKSQPWGWDYSGSSNMEELQILLETTVMIRRLKRDVITQLPDKLRMTIVLDPSAIKLNSKSLQAAAKQFKQESLRGSEKHGALIQFFTESALVKAKAVCEYVKELLTEGDKKFLIFAHHRIMMDKISETCDEQKVHYIRIDGNTNSESRQKLVDHFQTNTEIRVAVLSITAASTGITLTAAQLVVFAELYWNPGFLVQAEDRAHRIGQVDSVLVQYLVAKGTADDVIWPLVQSKLNILNKAGLSKDNFSCASSSNQNINVSEGILKYFSEIKEGESVEDNCEGSSSSSSFKRKRSDDACVDDGEDDSA